jgi:ribosomal-protein-alanine N-acetyltransferase
MAEEILVRLSSENLSGLADIERHSFHCAWSTEELRSLLADPKVWCLGALRSRQLAAYILGYFEQQQFHLASMAVAPQFRRQGLGATLLRCMLEEMQSRAYFHCTLEVRSSNRAALALYHKMGFIQVQRCSDYYQDPREDALKMELVVELL